MSESVARSKTVGAAGSAVWELADKTLGRHTTGLALDAAAGGGGFTGVLDARGFQVVASDLVNQFQSIGTPFIRLDLDSHLPFRDGAFDLVALIEALGYLENPASFIRESWRVLRPDGRLLITIPNSLSLQSRLRFTLNGTYRWFPHPQYTDQSKSELADTYRDPLRFTTLCFLIERAGFEIESVEFGGESPMRLLMPIGWGLQLLSRAHSAARRGRGKQTPILVNSMSALFSTNVGILARKRGESNDR